MGSQSQYEPLPSGYIRLLRLEPSKDTSSPLKGELLPVELNNSAVYEALSYTWGAPAQVFHIHLPDSQTIGLTSNLASALVHLRKTDESRVLWIDQICINQQNIPERNAQVAMMSKIYTYASQVVVWIGERDSDSDMGLQFLPVLLEKVRLHTPDSSYPVIDPVRTLGLMTVGSPAWKALSDLFSRPYFRRVWIVQEIVLGRDRAVKVRCGPWEGDWEDLALASRQYEFNNVYADNAHDAVAGINSMRLALTRKGEKIALLDLLFGSYFLCCGDLRDKVYGIVGLAADALVSPDYALSVEQVYTQTATQLIEGKDGLAVLSCVVQPKALELPSWVPDWSCKVKIRQKIPPATSIRTAHYTHAEPHPELRHSVSCDGKSLLVSCKILGHITETAEMMRPLEFYKVLPQWEELAKRQTQGNDITFPERYWRALVATEDGLNTSEIAKSGAECYDAWQNVMDTRYLGRSHLQSLDEAGTLSLDELNRRSGVFQNLMEASCIGRCLMLAGKGTLALGPDCAVAGDIICWIYGALTPLVVRQKQSGEAELVGACFLQGERNGPSEGWSQNEKLELV